MQVRVYIDSEREFRLLLALYPDIVWYEQDFVEVIADQDKLDEINALSLVTEIVHEDVVQFYRSRLADAKMGDYRDLIQINEKIDSIIAANPTIVSPKTSIGQFLEGRDIWGYKISDNPTIDEAEPEVLYITCIFTNIGSQVFQPQGIGNANLMVRKSFNTG